MNDVSELATEVAQLRADNARLRMVARNANLALQAQTDSLQQFLIPDAAPVGSTETPGADR